MIDRIPPAFTPPQPIGEIRVLVFPDMSLSVQARVPNKNVGLLAFEGGKQQFLETLAKKEQKSIEVADASLLG